MKIHSDISHINQEQWKELVDNSPNTSFFQTRECYDFFASLSFLKPFIYGASIDGKLKAVVCGYIISDGSFVKKFLSRRAIVPGGLLLHSGIEGKFLTDFLVSVKKELKNKAIYLEIRNYTDYSSVRTPIERSGLIYHPHLNFHVATPDIDTALKQLSTTKRRDIKLSRSAGAEWFETKDEKDISDYYAILSLLYKTKVKTPLFPLEFFRKIALLPNGKIFVLKFQDEVIGGSVCVVLPDRTIYEWFVCGLDGQVKNVFPSTVATWAAIEYAANSGLSRFDMMGAGRPDDGYGVREFKSKFGGELVEHGRFMTVFKPALYKIGKAGVQFYRTKFKLPSKKNKKVSTIKIETNVDSINKQAWAAFVKNHPNGNIFQTPEMFEVYKKTNKFSPEIIIALNKNDNIVGVLLTYLQREYKGIVGDLTSRAIVYGGPLVENNSPEVSALLLKKFDVLVKKSAIYAQFRNLFPMDHFKSTFIKNKFQYIEHLDILLDLTKTQDQLQALLHKERKRNIGIAIKNELEFRHLKNSADIEDVIGLVKKTYSRVKVPMSYDELFKSAEEILGSNIHFFGAYYKNKMIAGQIRLCYKGLVYAWFAGSDADYLNKRPNDFLQWNVILWAKTNNYKVFDFGGAGKPNVAYGVRDYKLKFGGELVSYGRFEKTYKSFLMLIGKSLYSIYNTKKR